MATKTVVCPECGSPAAPGRYACSECGAMLASVAMAPRGSTSADPAEREDDPDGESLPDSAAAAARDDVSDASDAPVAVPVSSLIDAAEIPAAAEAAPAAATGMVDPTEGPHLDGPTGLDGPTDADAGPFDENAPIAAVRAAVQPAVLRDVAEEPPAIPVESGSAASPAPSWPPPGDRGPIVPREPRTPAGAYLPPSAVLPPLDAPGGGVSVTGPGSAGRSSNADDADGSASSGLPWAARGSAALSDALASIHVPAAAGRRAVAIGAGVAALGFVLPWVNTIPGSSPLANYLDRWGLVGAGAWVILVVVVALAAIAASSGRVGSWPVGLPAVAMGAFLGGLVWPWVASGSGRSIGVLVVVVGALVLLVGGLLDRRARHDDGDASV